MKRSRLREERITGALKEHQAGTNAANLCRKYRTSDGRFIRALEVWRNGGVRCRAAERA